MGRRPRRGSPKSLGQLLALAVLVVVIWGVGLFRFADSIPHQVDDTTTHTDAIVVLTGGSGRVAEGLDLLAADKGKKLFVSGVYRGIDVKSLLQTVRDAPGGIEDRIGIGTAEDTIGNAAETAEWMREEGFTSLRLVTGAYHMPRSLLEFRVALPDVEIVPHPVFPEHVKQDRWWAWPGTAALLASEYNKYLLAVVRGAFVPPGA